MRRLSAPLALASQRLSPLASRLSPLASRLSPVVLTPRNATDNLGQKFEEFDRGDQEKNASARKTFKALSNSMEKLGAQQAMQIGRLNSITAQLEPFKGRCKTAQSSLDEYSRQAKNLREKTKAAANSKGKSAAMAEKELEGAQAQEEGAARDLGKVMQEFENERTQLLKVVLGDFIHLHIEYHAKALERYTEMYREHDGIVPDNIEEIVGLHQSRPALDNV
eukprot:COSAG06_NODE_6511_length_2900_cov_4.248126_4_plen_222_part_00